MEKAIDKLRAHWAAGEYRKALKLAAAWPRLGEHKKIIQQAWSATNNPDFYRQLNIDPDAVYAAGLAAIAERYELANPHKETVV